MKNGKWGWRCWLDYQKPTGSLRGRKRIGGEVEAKEHFYRAGCLDLNLKVKKVSYSVATMFLSVYAQSIDLHAYSWLHKMWRVIPFRERCLWNRNTFVTPQFVLPEKSCTCSLRLYKCEESVFFTVGQKKSFTERCTVGKKKTRKKICTPLLMFEIKFKKMKTLRNVPYFCKLYLLFICLI